MKHLFFLILFFTLSLQANPDKKSEELCNCLKKAKTSNVEKDKKKCLQLREKHVKALKKDSEDYNKYSENLQVCERDMMASPAEKNPPDSMDGKIAAVCECFTNAAAGKGQKFSCFQMQSNLGKKISNEEERIQFNNATNSCDK